MPTRFDAVLFDLDGTLLDTAPDLGAAVNHVLATHDYPLLPETLIRQIASDGALALLKAGFGADTLAQLDSQGLRQSMLDYYAAHLYIGTRPYPGMIDCIAWLNAQGIRWGVVTNKPAFLTDPLLAQAVELPACGVAVSADTLPLRKPHPEPMWYACEQLAVDPARCLYVGDHIRDIEAGRAAGMRTAVAGWGYIEQDEAVAGWGADHYFADVPALLGWLQQQA